MESVTCCIGPGAEASSAPICHRPRRTIRRTGLHTEKKNQLTQQRLHPTWPRKLSKQTWTGASLDNTPARKILSRLSPCQQNSLTSVSVTLSPSAYLAPPPSLFRLFSIFPTPLALARKSVSLNPPKESLYLNKQSTDSGRPGRALPPTAPTDVGDTGDVIGLRERGRCRRTVIE